ncbi:MAG TPA: DUF1801 domain-containing protein [Ideonella sp.]|nr:DUF1801 domain-containing protein [Ideonella sp.]
MRSASSSRALVAAWFDFQTTAQRELSEALRTAVREAEPSLTEGVKWGKLVFLLDGRMLLAIAPHKTHVHLQVFNGSQLPTELAPLDGAGHGLRNLRCRLHQPVDPVQVEMVVAASAELARRQGADLGLPRDRDD